MRKDLNKIDLFFSLTIIVTLIACVPWGVSAQIRVPRNYSNMAEGEGDLLKSGIDIGTPPEGKGNLILVAGGDINYTALSQQTKRPLIGMEADQSRYIETSAPYFQTIQALASYVLDKFRNSGYETEDIFYFNPNPLLDTDNDGIINQSAVGDSTPTKAELLDAICNWAMGSPNTGPLYIYLIGHGSEDRFQIMPNEVLKSKELKNCLDRFQNGYTGDDGIHHPGTNRQVIVIIESGASGTFIDDLKGPNSDITIITSADRGASYIKPDFTDPNVPYNSFTTAFINSLAPHLDPNTPLIEAPDDSDDTVSHIITSLKWAFLSARDQLKTWSLSGPPFAGQTPQMALPYHGFTSIYFSRDGKTPIDYLSIRSITPTTATDENDPLVITLIGQDPNHNLIPLPPGMKITFFSYDIRIIDPSDIKRIDPNIPKTNIWAEITPIENEMPATWYKIYPKKNGRLTLIAHANPDLFLSAKLTIEVSVKKPGYAADLERMAIIITGYKGTGDFLWESSNTITNHVYKILRATGYTKDEIHYYNPYSLQDLDENNEFDDIDGYPGLGIFDPNTSCVNTFDSNTCYAIQHSPFEKIRQSTTPIRELIIFLTDQGIRQGTFSINPTKSSLTAEYLIDQIKGITDKVSDKIILIYDACYSGSFISKIEEIEEQQISGLSKKLLTITSTDSNQIAYYLNKGTVSFSYPFFIEWYITHSFTRAFSYATETLPCADPNLSDCQTPCISDYSLAETWDEKTIYYMDESIPVFGDVQVNRSKGILHIAANVFSLKGIKDVWAIVESADNNLTSIYGKAITEAPLFYLSPRSNDPNACVYGGDYYLNTQDPCPNDKTNYVTIYATDNSKIPKLASHSIRIENPDQKTKVLIIASDPVLFPTLDARQRLLAQVNRAEEILEYKGLSKSDGDILYVSGVDINSLDDLSNVILSHFPLEKDITTLFIYIIGHSGFGPDNTPCFYINPKVTLTPRQFSTHIPMDPNERLLLLMDAPFAQQFLSAIDPNTLPRNWAGISSTNKKRLFFPFEGGLFPCFSDFFFSTVLSGATVSQAYRMAENAVSLTWQKPGLLLPEKTIDNQVITLHLDYYLGTSAIQGEFLGRQTNNRHLDYYLGTSAIQGEDYSLFTGCSALFDTETGEYHLSLTPRPDANIRQARAVLKSPTLSLLQESMIVDLDPNSLTADKGSDIRYYSAFFMVEGTIRGEADLQTTWTDWEEVPIAETITKIEKDTYEPDDAPNSIILDPNHRIIINDLPQKHTFYCGDPNDPNGCTDIDWVYFYAEKDHIYKIHSQDLSENEYLIQPDLYDPNLRPLCENGVCVKSIDSLVFLCHQSGYYLLKMQLASNDFKKGAVYSLFVVDLMTGEIAILLLTVIDPDQRGIYCSGWHCIIGEIPSPPPLDPVYRYPTIYSYGGNSRYYYKFNDLTPHYTIILKACIDMNCNEPTLAEVEVEELIPNYLNSAKLDLSDIDPNDYMHHIDLPPGWSMISLPVIPDSKTASHLFPDANVIYKYSRVEGYVRVRDDEDLEERKGYWIQSDTNRSCLITGRTIPSDPLQVQENGWYMIGGCTSPVKALVDEGNIVAIYGFLPGYGYKRLLASDCLEPGKGYWIMVRDIPN